jgi:hypothetical protein
MLWFVAQSVSRARGKSSPWYVDPRSESGDDGWRKGRGDGPWVLTPGMPNNPSYSATTEYPGERSECLGLWRRV